jgi:hypothetical protein
MAFRLYIVPQIGTGTSQDPRRAKYLSALGGASSMDFGFQPCFLVAIDLSPANDAAVVAHADVFAFPFDLSGQMGSEAAATSTFLENNFFIPCNWMTGSTIWLEAARAICGMFQYFQRLNVILGNVVPIDGTTNKSLNTQFNAFSAEVQAGIIQAAQSLSYDTSFIANNTQVRAILKNFSDQWGNKPFIFGQFVI